MPHDNSRKQPLPSDSLVFTRLSDVRPQRIAWLWQDRIPRGMVTIVAGDGGRGKSTLMLDLVARLTAGRPLPGEPEGSICPSGVIIFSAEDHLASVVVPRLECAGAKLRLVITSERQLTIGAEDLQALEAQVVKESVSLVIFDPLVAYVDAKTNLHHNQDARRVLGFLHDLAQRTSCAVVAIHHFNKALHVEVANRLNGSTGIVNASRSLLVVGADPQERDRGIIIPGKHNLAAKGTEGYAFKLVPAEGSEHATVEWCGPVETTVDQLLPLPGDARASGKVEDGCRYLEQRLARGPVRVPELEDDAPCSPRTLAKAKKRLGIAARRRADGWYWVLPEDPGIESPPPVHPCVDDPKSVGGNGLDQGCNTATEVTQ